MQQSMLKSSEISGNIPVIEDNEFDAGDVIAYRSKLKEISAKTFWIVGSITLVLAFVIMLINSIYYNETFTYIACSILCVVGIILIIQSPIANSRNALIQKVNTYPNIAITYANPKFYIITDSVHEIDVADIEKVEYAKLQLFNSAWLAVSTVGVVKIKTNRGTILVYQVSNALHTVKMIKKILSTYKKKS